MSADVSILACSPSIFTLREIDSQKRVQCYHGGTSTSRSQHEPISRGRCIKQGGDGIRQVLGSFSTKWKQNLNDFFDQVTSAKKINGLDSECIADVFSCRVAVIALKLLILCISRRSRVVAVTHEQKQCCVRGVVVARTRPPPAAKPSSPHQPPSQSLPNLWERILYAEQ